MSHPPGTDSIGASIRRWRLDAGLTLVSLADRSGLSQPFLSQVENGKATPSIDSLYRIATALGTTPQGLFQQPVGADAGGTVRRADDAEVPTLHTDGESLRRLLLPGGTAFHVIELVGFAADFREYWQHDGLEAMYVVHGPVDVDVDGTVSTLSTGDFISYPANAPHRYRSSHPKARAVLVESAGVRHSAGPASVDLSPWHGPWDDDDKDANFKADVALYAKVDPLHTVRGLSSSTDVPIGAIVRWVLARWASEGAGGLLELGPTMTRRLDDVCRAAEAEDTDEARLAAFSQLRQMISWLRYPLDHPEVYEDGVGLMRDDPV